MPSRYIVAVADDTEKSAILAQAGPKAAGVAWQRNNNTLYVRDPDSGTFVAVGTVIDPSAIPLTQDSLIIGDASNEGTEITLAALLTALGGVAGVAADYKIARGQHTTVDADDTIVTGLATVVAAVAVLESDPAIDCDRATCVIGDQAGAPAAGSIQIKTWQPTDNTDPTPIAATAFAKLVNWIAIGT